MDKQPKFLFGINPILEKLKASPHDISEILIAKGSSGSALRGIDTQAKRLGIRVKYVPPDLLDRLVGWATASRGSRQGGGLFLLRLSLICFRRLQRTPDWFGF